LPNWLRDNYFLQHGHRVEMNSWHECFRSLGFWHNETANIYTHLVGFAVLSVWGVFSMVDLASREPTVDDEETGPFFISWLLAFVRRHADVFAMVPTFIGAISCLGFSAVFHLVYCHSPKVCHHANKLDYAGIILLISGSTLSTVYFGLRCDGDLRLPYLTFSMATGFICCYVLVYKSSLQSPRYAWLRVAAFTMLACSGLVPVLHSLRRHDWSYVNMAWQFTTYTLPSGMMQLVGGVMYAIKFPERFAPGRFDYLFHSHANFHVIVVAAIVVHAVGL
ncbi:hemolysin-III related-domain-containing protein, partial [Hyaloraphidium curvatum]